MLTSVNLSLGTLRLLIGSVPTLPVANSPTIQGGVITLPPRLGDNEQVEEHSGNGSSKLVTVLEAEGIPLISSKLVNKIKRREYLFSDIEEKMEELLIFTSFGNQVLYFTMQTPPPNKRLCLNQHLVESLVNSNKCLGLIKCLPPFQHLGLTETTVTYPLLIIINKHQYHVQ